MSKPTKPKINFSEELKELEAIADWFESENVNLDQALLKIERGMELAVRLKHHLQTVENQVETVKQKFDRTKSVGNIEDNKPDAPDKLL